MLILFDHGTPVPLRGSLIGHVVATAYELAWATLKNGALMESRRVGWIRAIDYHDKNLAHQQNLRGRKIAIIALGQANWPIVRNHIPQIVAAINAATVGSYQLVEM